MNFIKLSIITILLSIGLKSYTTMELASNISTLDINMQYYFFVEDKKAFLIRERNNKTYSLWYYTSDRKWQPIHNASAFDGFGEAMANLSNILVNKTSEQITFGNINNNNIDNNIKDLLSNVANKTVKIGWYFWANQRAFLIKRNPNNEISIWHYASGRKWQPVHNASAFDGFPKAGKTFDNVVFIPSSNTLSLGSVINENGMKMPPMPSLY